METDDTLIPTEMSGTLSLNGSFITDSEILDIASDDARPVIPLLITHKSSRAAAWNAAVMERFRSGSIRRIYMWLTIPPKAEMSEEAILSSAKGIGLPKNARCSVKSRSKTRALICVYYLPRWQSSLRSDPT